jgi:hypothetical protein
MLPFPTITRTLATLRASREAEYAKSEHEKQADLSYTASHALMCLLTDFTPILSHLLQGKGSNLFSHLEGEVLGDVSGVVATVAIQRLTPEVMAAFRAGIEPIARPIYELSSRHEAKAWAEEHAEVIDSPAYLAHKVAHYEKEISKLPMGVMWTVTSLLLNAGYQVSKRQLSQSCHLGLPNLNEDAFWCIAESNLKGALITFALTNGARVVFPRQTHTIDRFSREAIAEPISNLVTFITGHGTITDQTEQGRLTLMQ